MSKFVTENNVSVLLETKHDNPTNCITFYNPVMKVNREFVLSTLGAYSEEREGETKCLDAFGATGIVGLQWKHHVKFPMSITINDLNPVCVANITSNCERNGFMVMKGDLPLGPAQLLGDGENKVPAEECAIKVTQEDANVLMHKVQYNFIFADPFGSSVQFLDALFRNVFHKGMVVLTATDVASLYGKCPQVTKRNYSAYTVRTDYTKEMAARIVIAEASRAAAKCNKGFDVMYTVAVEHFVQVGLKIRRGANHANQCVSQISSFLHCLHCQEWGQIPNTNSPVELMYSHLPCSCKMEYPGHTAVVVGPMWNGEIFNTDFVRKMQMKATEYKLSDRTQSLLKTMVIESQCLAYTPINISPSESIVKENTKNEKEQTGNDSDKTKTSFEKVNSKVISKCKTNESDENVNNIMETEENSDNVKKEHVNSPQLSSSITEESSNKSTESQKNVVHGCDESNQKTGESFEEPATKRVQQQQLPGKRALSDACDDTITVCHKKIKTIREYSDSQVPLFFYSLHKRRVKGVDVPKVAKLIKRLHMEGYRASQTLFDTHGLRTNATLGELTDLLKTFFSQKKS